MESAPSGAGVNMAREFAAGGEGVLALKTAAQLTGPAAGAAGFDAAGQLARNGTRPLQAQIANNTCGPTSVGMALDTLNSGRSSTNIINLELTARGTTMDRLSALLNANGTNATLRSGASLGDIGTATAQGNPVIAHVNMPGGGGHFLVVDGVTTRMGQSVVAIRDPLGGGQYFELASRFMQRFSGWIVTVP